ncbi:MAG: YIP1 family protein [Deltaproteobacteria bacterium]|nr:YIP1 family protein [Deltaproteobacteria bacterium]
MRRAPLVSFWTSPVDTFRAVLDGSSPRGVLLLSALSAWGFVTPGALRPEEDIAHQFATSVGLTLLPLAAIGALYLRGMVVAHIGQWLGGVATTAQARLALAWSSLPLAALSLAHLPLLLKSNATHTATGSWALVLAAVLAWSFWTEVKLIAVAHEFGRLRATVVSLCSVILPVLGLLGAGKMFTG